MPDQNTPLEPGQLNTIPVDNYNVNANLGQAIDNTRTVGAPASANLLIDTTLPIPRSGDGGAKINPLYAAYLSTLKNSPINPLSGQVLTNLDNTTRYENNEIGGFNPYDLNQENWYGENQSWLDQMGNRIGKFGVKALGSFAGALMDIPNMISAIGEGSTDKMWDNPTNNWANDLMEWSEKAMPNYQTNWEIEHPFQNYIPFYGNAGNSWGKVLENVGFTVGAIGGAVVEDLAVGAVTGGVGEIPLAAMQINKAIYKLGKLVGAGGETMQALKGTIRNADDIVKGLKGIDRFNYAARQGLWGANMITSGFSEAAFEGIESYKTLSKDLKQDFFNENGRMPTYEEAKEIDSISRDAGNARFKLNAALLAVTNSIQWGSLMKPFNAVKDIAEQELKAGVRVALKEGSRDVFEAAVQTNKLARFGTALRNNKVADILAGSSPEAFEEGSQFLIQNGVDEFYKRKYDEPSISFTNNFTKSFGDALSKTLSTTEGWDNMIAGLLGGAMYKGGEHLYYKAKGQESPNYKKQVDAVVAGLNTTSLSGIFENKYGETVAAAAIQADMQKAAESGNNFLYQNYKHEQLVNFVISGIKQNKFDTRMEQMEELRKLDDAEFQKTFGIPATEANRRNASAIVDNMQETAKFIQDTQTRVSRTFINPFSYKGTGNYKNAEQKAEQDKQNEQYLAYEEVKDQLVYGMGISRDSERRSVALRGSIGELDSFISPDLAIQLSSDEGLGSLKQEYALRVKELEESRKLAKTPASKKELDWFSNAVADIDAVMAETDSTKQQAAYNELIATVLDKVQEQKDITNNGGKKPKKKSKYDRIIGNQVVRLGGDIARLRKRNEAAVANYAALTTKGGFKSLFDKIMDIRRKIADAQIALAPPPDPNANPQQAAAQAAAGIPAGTPANPQDGTSTLDPNGKPAGELVETQKALDDEQRRTVAKYRTEAVDKKRTLANEEAEFLDFDTIDNLKFNNPKLDLKDYEQIKSTEGKNWYILKSVIADDRAALAAPPIASGVPVPPNGQQPDVNGSGKGKEPLRIADFYNRVFVPADTKQAFQTAIQSFTKDQIANNMTIVVTPLSAEQQAKFDKQRNDKSYTEVAGYPGVYVTFAPVNFELRVNGVTTYIPYPQRVRFKKGNALVSIDKLTPQEYQDFTGVSSTQHAADVTNFNRMVSVVNALQQKMVDAKGPVTISNTEAKKLLGITVSYGELDLVGTDADRPLFSALQNTGITLTAKNGSKVTTPIILSIPKTFVADKGARAKTELINIIANEAFYTNPDIDERAIRSWINSNVDKLHAVGSRYVGLVRTPDGAFHPVALRPATMSKENADTLFDGIKTRSEESFNANQVPGTKEDNDGRILEGETTIYYKLVNDAAKEFNKDFNESLNDNIYISDSKGQSEFTLSMSPIGSMRLEIYNRVADNGKPYRTTIHITPNKLANIKSMDDFFKAVSRQIEVQSKKDAVLKALAISVGSTNLKQNIVEDTNANATTEVIGNQLTAATTPTVFKNARINLIPNGQAATTAFNAAGGSKPANQPENKGAVLQPTPAGSVDALTGKGRTEPVNTSVTLTRQQKIDALEKRRESELRVAEYTGGKDAKGRQIGVSAEKIRINKAIDAEIAALPADVSANTATIPGAVSLGSFGGISFSTDDQGNPTLPADMVKDAASGSTPAPVSKTNSNQEDWKDREFDTVEAGLKAAGIRVGNIAGGIFFIDIATGQAIDGLDALSPAELAKSMGIKLKARPKSQEEWDFMANESGPTGQVIDMQKAREYLASILPNYIRVEELDPIINEILRSGRMTGKIENFGGMFGNRIIFLNTKTTAPGVEYHEAFHAVFQLLLLNYEQKPLLAYARNEQYKDLKKQGQTLRQYIDRYGKHGQWDHLTYEQKLDRAAEEWMAEKFRNWKNKKNNAGPLQKLFDLIERFFKFITGRRTELEMLFRKIDSGYFKYSKFGATTYDEMNNVGNETSEFNFMLVPARPTVVTVGKGEIVVPRKLDPKTSRQAIQSVASYASMYRKFKDNVKLSDDEVLDKVLDDLKLTYSANNPLYAGYTQEQLNAIVGSDNGYIYSNEESRATIKEEAQKYIDTINYIEQYQNEEQEIDEQDKGTPQTGYDNRSENVGGYSSLPGLLRQFIGFTTYEKVDEFGNKALHNGVPIIGTVDAVQVYYGIMRAVANTNDPVLFFQKLVKFAEDNEQSNHFLNKFVNETGLDTDALMRGEIVANGNKTLLELFRKGFNKYRIDYVFTEHDIKKQAVKSYHANRKNVDKTQVDNWANNYIANFAEYSEDAQKAIRENLTSVIGKHFDAKRNRLGKYTPAALNTAITETQNVLRSIGINVSRSYLKYSLLAEKAKVYDELAAKYKKEGKTLAFDDASNKTIDQQDYQYVQIMKIGDEITLTPDFMNQMKAQLAAGNNPFFITTQETQVFNEETGETTIDVQEVKESAMIGRLLKVALGNASFDESVGESSYTSAENKIIYAHQDGTFHVKQSVQLRDANYRKQLKEEGFREEQSAYRDAYDADWLTKNFLLNNPAFEAIADNLLFQRIDGMRAVETNKLGKVITEEFRDQKEGAVYGHYSPREFLINLTNMYVSYAQEQRTSAGSFMTAPHLIRVLEASNTADTVNLPINTDVYKAGSATAKTTDILFQEFTKEYDRINRVNGEIGKITENVIENYHTGAFAEDGVTVLNGYRGLKFTDNMTSLMPRSLSDALEMKARAGETLSTEDINNIKANMVVRLNEMVDASIDMMVSEDVISRDEQGNLKNILLDNQIEKGNDKLNLGNKLKENIGHIIVNDYINTLSYNQILHGDSALGIKNDGGIDAVKRAKGDNAAIVSMRTDLIDPSLGITRPFTHSSVAIFKEPKGANPFGGKAIDVADAQMYTTVEGLRYTMWGLGRLTPRLANVLNAMEQGQDLRELRDLEGKPYDAIFDASNGLLKHDEMTNSLKLVYKDGKSYFKMSVVVLQPSLTSYQVNGEWKALPGWESMHNLRTSMEAKGIQFAAPQSASKMMTIDVGRDNKGFTDLKGHLFDNTFFGLQTANPSNKLEITTPTQLLQLIDSEQDDSTVVRFNGEDTTVKAVKKAYQGYVAQRVTNNYDIAKNEIYEITDLSKDLEDSIEAGEVTPRLAAFQKRAIETLEVSGADAQLMEFFSLDENGNPKYDLNMSATKEKFGQLYLAYFSKGIMSQKNPGYTVALMSGMDTKFMKRVTKVIDGKVVAWEVIRRDQFNANTNGVQDETWGKGIDDVSEVGDVFLAELAYNVPEYDDNGNITGYFSEMAMPPHFQEMLDIDRNAPIPEAVAKMFGVRIPSQDKHSFMSFKLVDYLPANLGSTAMFPKELIALSGADFDIDKEYLSRYDFYVTKDAKGKVQFKKYGDATTEGDKYEEYKIWMSKNNKVFKGRLKDAIANDADYQGLVAGTSDLVEDIENTQEIKSLQKDIKDGLITRILGEMGLPNSIQAYAEASRDKELNNGVLNNRIVDSYITLLTNDKMRDIAATPATLTALQDVQKESDITVILPNGETTNVFSSNRTFPVDSLMGKYNSFKNNTTGKDNIGIDVNANLIYSVFNKGSIAYKSTQLTPEELAEIEKNPRLSPPTPLEFDGVTFASFAGDLQYNLRTGMFDGPRTNDILSTLISSATDEAKEQLNALYNLGVDALKVVNYLIALKVPLKTAIYMVNQPSIKYYLDLKKSNNNTVRTKAEEDVRASDFIEIAVERVKAEAKEYDKYTDDELLGMFEREGLLKKDC